MKNRQDKTELTRFENMVKLIKNTCNHQTNCNNCPFNNNGQCAVMILTTAEFHPCEW